MRYQGVNLPTASFQGRPPIVSDIRLPWTFATIPTSILMHSPGPLPSLISCDVLGTCSWKPNKFSFLPQGKTYHRFLGHRCNSPDSLLVRGLHARIHALECNMIETEQRCGRLNTIAFEDTWSISICLSLTERSQRTCMCPFNNHPGLRESTCSCPLWAGIITCAGPKEHTTVVITRRSVSKQKKRKNIGDMKIPTTSRSPY